MQIYDTPFGPAFWVRTESGPKSKEHLFATVRDGKVSTFWRPEIPGEYILVHDDSAIGARVFVEKEADALVKEKAILLECLEAALGMMDARAAEQVRDIYRTKIKGLDIVSMTKPTDLVEKGA